MQHFIRPLKIVEQAAGDVMVQFSSLSVTLVFSFDFLKILNFHRKKSKKVKLLFCLSLTLSVIPSLSWPTQRALRNGGQNLHREN